MNYGKRNVSKKQKALTSKSTMKKETGWCPRPEGSASYADSLRHSRCRRCWIIR